jgi:hypothetical protein
LPPIRLTLAGRFEYEEKLARKLTPTITAPILIHVRQENDARMKPHAMSSRTAATLTCTIASPRCARAYPAEPDSA